MSQDTDALREALEDIRNILGPKPGFVGQQILAIANKALFAAPAPERRDEWTAAESPPKRAIKRFEVIAHFAEDLSGEEQPPFKGWFHKVGWGCVEVPGKPIRYRALPPALRTTKAPAEGERT